MGREYLERLSESSNVNSATVTATYLRYNDTIVSANRTTHFVPGANDVVKTYNPGETVSLPGISTTLLDGFTSTNNDPIFHAITALEPTPAVTIGNMTIQSPTAYTQGVGLFLAGWGKYSDGSSVSDGSIFWTNVYGYGSPTLAVETATDGDTTYSSIVERTMSVQYRSALVEQISSIRDAGFPLSSCSVWGGCSVSGEPTG